MKTSASLPLRFDQLKVSAHPDRGFMGQAAGLAAAHFIRDAIASRGTARIIVASAPSQDETLAVLTGAEGVEWEKVAVFHMDEYIGLPDWHPATFRAYQEEHLLAKVRPACFHGIRGEASDAEGECARYAALLGEAPIDLVCMGIGENGHIAFNDPPVADFNDPLAVKVVELDEACRRQQVNDGCFPDIDLVPRRAISLTCPALMSARHLVCSVPGSRKAEAVRATLTGPVSTACPASILRTHASATLYLDHDSASRIPMEQRAHAATS